MLTLFLLEIDCLGKDDSANLVLDFELCVGSSARKIVLVVKASPP
jgi:hypothetical protein